MKGPRSPRLVRAVVVTAVVAALGVVPAAPAGAQGLSSSPDRSAEQAQGRATLREALERDLGLAGAELDELLAASARATVLDARLREELGDGYAGSWFDRSTGSLTVAVTDRGTASVARAAGAAAVLAGRSEHDLAAIRDELTGRVKADPDTWAPAVSWGVDVRANQVLVTVRTGQAGSVQPLLAEYGDAVRIEETAGEPTLTAPPDAFLDGGEPLDTNGGPACSFSFNVRSTTTADRFVLTAAHCGTPGTIGFSYGVAIGPFTGSWPAFGDALVRKDNPFWAQGPWVWTWPGFVVLGGWTDAPIGTPICKSGRATGWTCGIITAKSVFLPGMVVGFTQHTACVEPGDSGGATVNVSSVPYRAEGTTQSAVLIAGRCRSVFGLPNISWYLPFAISRGLGIELL
jgi:alpha-lytic protease prodomain-containing protein